LAVKSQPVTLLTRVRQHSGFGKAAAAGRADALGLYGWPLRPNTSASWKKLRDAAHVASTLTIAVALSMSTAHTCFRSALTQAFRSPKSATAAPHTISAFLVPALRTPRRPFSSGKRRSKLHPAADHAASESASKYRYASVESDKSNKLLVDCSIPIPRHSDRGDIEEWLAAIEPFLPGHLRRDPVKESEPTSTVTAFDLAFVLSEAQDSSLDILSHLGLVEGRWQTVVWIVKKLVDGGRHSLDLTGLHESLGNNMWPDAASQTLDDLVDAPIRITRTHASSTPQLTLDELTADPGTIHYNRRTIRRALGQLWRSLGNMIIFAAGRHDSEREKIMPFALEIIAHLHHMGFMHDSVYTYRPHGSKHAFQQPPTLHLLSSKILTALSDATWNAHEASVRNAKARANASYFLGHEIPGSRYKVEVTGISPELWLELVLWSCLHGGWVLDGAAILEKLAAHQREQGWRLISWQEIMESERQKGLPSLSDWNPFLRKSEVHASAEDRARTRKTVSSEVVTGFIDGLVNEMRLGVGQRGAAPEMLVDHMNTLKRFLETSNHNLGSAAWDSIVARLLDSAGLIPENSPALMLRISPLAAGFGTEVSAINAANDVDAEVPYFFEPTTISLSLLHRTMRAYLKLDDMKGVMATLELLQQHTDNNKQKSLHQFFESLKTLEMSSTEPFTSRLPPVDFPSFDNQVPVPLLAKLLDRATESKMYDLGRWLLLSKDLDGPLIGRDMYSHPSIAASIVRFGTMAGEHDLVLEIINQVDKSGRRSQMTATLFTALFCSQIKLHRWGSVLSMQEHAIQDKRFAPRATILSTFAGELLRTSCRSEEERTDAQTAFSELLFSWETPILDNIQNELYCTLAVMSTISDVWKEFCSQFLAFSKRQSIKLTPYCFNQLLDGALEAYGSSKGVELVEKWCYAPSEMLAAYRAPGGLPTMSRSRPDKGKELSGRFEEIKITQEWGTKLILRGRIGLNRRTILAILRKVQEEVEQWRHDGHEIPAAARAKARQTALWAARLLRSIGQDTEDIVRDLGSLEQLVGIEALVASTRR
jgi:hypothetical protein